MKRPQVSIVAGFPDFWQHVHDLYPSFFKAAEELGPLVNASIQKPVGDLLHKVLAYVTLSVSDSFGALITLVLNGYGNDAMVIARRMFEGELTVAYLRRHPDQLEDYLDFHAVQQKRLYDYTCRFAPQLSAGIPPERIAELEREFARVRPRFLRNNQLRPRWTEASVRKMAEEAGLIGVYLTVYAWASSMQHVDASGLNSQTDEAGLWDLAPSEQWLAEALITGHGAVLRTLDCYNSVAKLGMDAEIEGACQRFREAWQQAIPSSTSHLKTADAS